MLSFLTDFCDQAVILPAFAAAALVLVAQRRWFLAGTWVGCVAGVLGATLVLKLADQACGWTVPFLGPDGIDLRNPSGHAASAAGLWGALATLLVAGRGRLTAGTGLLAGSAAAVLIGITRVALGVHTVSDVIVGGLVGIAGALLFGIRAGSAAAGGGAALPVAVALLTVGITHGWHLPAEPTIHGAAVGFIRAHIPACAPPGWRTI